jgi:hypothetical protein
MDIKDKIAKLLNDEYHIPEEVTIELFKRRILFEPYIRNFLVREEYFKGIKPKMRNHLKSKLADEFCLSFKCIEKIVLQ